MIVHFSRLLILVPLLLCTFHSYGQVKDGQDKIPTIADSKGVRQLIVDGRPFIMLSGELHNSSASNLEYLEPTWDKLVSMHLNSVIATVSWELLEPIEGKFNFDLVDGLITRAREHHLKLVLIWFGTWKNAMSNYVPEWVKSDLARFPRMQVRDGRNSESISAFSREARKADALAFAALMDHIRKVDGMDHTVVMMQVENETGLMGTSIDRSEIAQKAYQNPVPEKLSKYLKANYENLFTPLKLVLESTGKISGSWTEVFGSAADEVFQAWYIASYVGEVVSAGKAKYPIPMYVNAWLDQYYADSTKISYLSGGPVTRVIDVWKAAAPGVDFYAPDIYLEDFKRVCEMYHQNGNPLFIPEAHRDSRAAANVFYALGQHRAMGFAPFGIDGNADSVSISKAYGLLTGFLPFLAENNEAKSFGFVYSGKDFDEFFTDRFRLRVRYNQKRDNQTNTPEAAGLILQTAPFEFYVAGSGFVLEITPIERPERTEILSLEEGFFVNGVWKAGRRLNGDELNLKFEKKPSFKKVKLHII